MANRQKDFRLGILHGKIKPEKDDYEAKLRNKIFLHQSITIKRSRNTGQNTDVRLFAYEMPLKENISRGNCVDLVGYDNAHNLYLIELKRGDNKQKLSEVIKEINGYASIVQCIKDKIGQDFEKIFYLSIHFKSIKKIILAPRKYYPKNKPEGIDNTIEYLYFEDDSIITKGLEAEKSWKPILLHVKRWSNK